MSQSRLPSLFIVLLALRTVVGAGPQMAAARALPSQTPIPGAPTAACEFPGIDTQTPLRILIGDGPIPYQFACGHNRPQGVCAIGTLAPGLIVNVGGEQSGWACITGGDSTSGWIPGRFLARVPATPRVPLAEWLGWWRPAREIQGIKNDRILITRKPGSDMLHVSGRAYWYGRNDSVHFGAVQANVMPIGRYLHAVEPFPYGGGCVVDLQIDPASHTLQAYDNMQCGGMNVRFAGVWNHFIPKILGR